jgi:hypothetical protein
MKDKVAVIAAATGTANKPLHHYGRPAMRFGFGHGVSPWAARG